MRRIYVRLDRQQAEALTQLAVSERRHPADQAAVLLTPVLARLASEQTTPKTKEAATTS